MNPFYLRTGEAVTLGFHKKPEINLFVCVVINQALLILSKKVLAEC